MRVVALKGDTVGLQRRSLVLYNYSCQPAEHGIDLLIVSILAASLAPRTIQRHDMRLSNTACITQRYQVTNQPGAHHNVYSHHPAPDVEFCGCICIGLIL